MKSGRSNFGFEFRAYSLTYPLRVLRVFDGFPDFDCGWNCDGWFRASGPTGSDPVVWCCSSSDFVFEYFVVP